MKIFTDSKRCSDKACFVPTKTIFYWYIAVLLIFVGSISSCKEKEEPKYDVYENHNISACGVNDPLHNIKWLKEYCGNIKEKKNFLSAHIHLYSIIDKDDYVFCISIDHSDFDDSPFRYTAQYTNCTGDLIINVNSGVPILPDKLEEFLKDKELVTEIFHFVKQKK